MSKQYTTQVKVKTKIVITKGNKVTPNQQGCIRVPLDHQPQEAEEDEASKEDTTPIQGDCTACSVERIRDIQQGLAKSQYKGRRK
jgi:hypothetical protein